MQLWLSHYPGQPESFGFPDRLALGLQQPVKQWLDTSAQVAFANLIGALETDAEVLSSAFSDGQREALGSPVERTPLRTALWDSDPDNVKWKKAELERARQLGEYSSDLNQVADEAREFRQ